MHRKLALAVLFPLAAGASRVGKIEATWTVVHAKKKASELQQPQLIAVQHDSNPEPERQAPAESQVSVKSPAPVPPPVKGQDEAPAESQPSAPPAEGQVPADGATSESKSPEVKEKTTKEKIWEMGKQMCKDRPDSPQCKHFAEQEKQLEEEKAVAEVEKITEAKESTMEAAPIESSTPAATTSAEATGTSAEATPVEVESTTAGPTAAPSQAPAKAQTTTAMRGAATTAMRGATAAELKEQGFAGDKVRHIDGQTETGDWHDEYEVPRPKTPAPTVPPARSAAPGCRLAMTVMAALLLQALLVRM